jgi:hypothetical protein
MNKEEILGAISDIRYNANDDEKAHSLEDQLREWFIQDIANSKNELAELARLVLSTNDIDFQRWYA